MNTLDLTNISFLFLKIAVKPYITFFLKKIIPYMFIQSGNFLYREKDINLVLSGHCCVSEQIYIYIYIHKKYDLNVI